MSPAILDAPAAPQTFTQVIPVNNLAVCTEKLADLRFLIILIARWEGSDNVERERRELMHSDLVRLRRQYANQIDEIAMSFGVQQAMTAQHDVEQRVKVPTGIQPPPAYQMLEEDDGLYF